MTTDVELQLRRQTFRLASIAILAVLATTAAAEPLPYFKQGQCSSGYVQSGSYCVPKSGGTVRPAVTKPTGASCPSGWTQSGGACERTKAIRRK
jgi:hypothetical protein